MYKIFKMEEVEVYIVDILMEGKNKIEHDQRVQEVLRRAKVSRVKFNKEKCVFGRFDLIFVTF